MMEVSAARMDIEPELGKWAMEPDFPNFLPLFLMERAHCCPLWLTEEKLQMVVGGLLGKDVHDFWNLSLIDFF